MMRVSALRAVHQSRKKTTLLAYVCLVALVTLFGLSAHSQTTESPLVMPAAPQQENLINFYKNTNMNFFVDKLSISVTPEGVVRFTLIAVTHSGAKTISYEGVNCQRGEKKLYAFGQADGSWSASRRNEWVSTSSANYLPHRIFARDFACLSNAADVNTIHDALQKAQAK